MEIKIIKEADDPICTRVSIGGDKSVGYYCVIRGEYANAINIIKHVLEELKKYA